MIIGCHGCQKNSGSRPGPRWGSISFFKEYCFRVRTRVMLGLGLGFGLTLTLT